MLKEHDDEAYEPGDELDLDLVTTSSLKPAGKTPASKHKVVLRPTQLPAGVVKPTQPPPAVTMSMQLPLNVANPLGSPLKMTKPVHPPTCVSKPTHPPPGMIKPSPNADSDSLMHNEKFSQLFNSMMTSGMAPDHIKTLLSTLAASTSSLVPEKKNELIDQLSSSMAALHKQTSKIEPKPHVKPDVPDKASFTNGNLVFLML